MYSYRKLATSSSSLFCTLKFKHSGRLERKIRAVCILFPLHDMTSWGLYIWKMIVAHCNVTCELEMQQVPNLVFTYPEKQSPPPNLKYTRGTVAYAVPVTAYFSEELQAVYKLYLAGSCGCYQLI